jgi:hypothetical protein
MSETAKKQEISFLSTVTHFQLSSDHSKTGQSRRKNTLNHLGE